MERVSRELNVLDQFQNPVDSHIHSALMRVPYQEIAKRGVWHLSALHHQIFLYSLSSEAIAEHVGGEMRYVERHHVVGRPLSTRHLRMAVLLRSGGVKGNVSNFAFICRAILRHFSIGKRNQQVRFFVTDRTRANRLAKGSDEDEDANMLGPSTTIRKTRRNIPWGFQRRAASGPRYPWLWEAWRPPNFSTLARKPVDAVRNIWRSSDENSDIMTEDAWDAVSHAMRQMGLKLPTDH